MAKIPQATERLKHARLSAGFGTASAAAQRFGWKISTYSAHENGQNEFGPDLAEKYGKAYKVRAAWLLTGDGEAPAHSVIPDMQDIVTVPEMKVRGGSGPGGSLTEDFSPDAVERHWGIPPRFIKDELRAQTAAVRIIEVMGDSMEPTVKPGDRVLIDTNHRLPSPPGVYAVWDGYGVVVKRVEIVPRSEPPQVTLISDNPHHKSYTLTVDDAHIVGRVICKISLM